MSLNSKKETAKITRKRRQAMTLRGKTNPEDKLKTKKIWLKWVDGGLLICAEGRRKQEDIWLDIWLTEEEAQRMAAFILGK
jgi:hypothetical protein